MMMKKFEFLSKEEIKVLEAQFPTIDNLCKYRMEVADVEPRNENEHDWQIQELATIDYEIRRRNTK